MIFNVILSFNNHSISKNWFAILLITIIFTNPTISTSKDHSINIQQLNTRFGKTDQVIFIEGKGKGGLPLIQINHAKASALISIYAGQVLSFHPTNQTEDMMFISEKAYFQQGKAIKGGIPICWPWFGDDPTNQKHPSHGFARNSVWSVVSVDVFEKEATQIKLEFSASEKTKGIWPYAFCLSLEISIGESLTLQLTTRNTGNKTFTITEALHAYFKVRDVSQLDILGLEHTEYQDKDQNFVKACPIDTIKVNQETDHIYTDIKHKLTIKDPSFNRKIIIKSSGNKQVVVWNPWKKGSANSVDLETNDYKHFVCVETANTEGIEISPNCEHTLMTRYNIL